MLKTALHTTPLHAWHIAHGARMAEFEGWDMPARYEPGRLKEHLATRRYGGLFDISHMGRFIFKGGATLSFLQHVLTNNAQALGPWHAQYTLIPNERGGVIDDAYLYRWGANEYMLVVNAATRQKDLEHLRTQAGAFPGVEVLDVSLETGMLALQGPLAAQMLADALEAGDLPDTFHNSLSQATLCGTGVQVARTGYTGEPVCFELVMPAERLAHVWEGLHRRAAPLGALPVGLEARDSLRVEAGLPLYGHEFGVDPDGREIPAFAVHLTRVAVSFADSKGFFIGRNALARQFEEAKKIGFGRPDMSSALPRRIRCLAALGTGVVQRGDAVFAGEHRIGVVTSCATAPCWKFTETGPAARITDDTELRSIALACVEANYQPDADVDTVARGHRLKCRLVKSHGRSEKPYFRPLSAGALRPASGPLEVPDRSAADDMQKVEILVHRALDNQAWRQQRCINLIPSEMTPSALVRALQTSDPAGRYATHRDMLAPHAADGIGYRGTDFIAWVEQRLAEELAAYLECPQVDARALSAQMATRIVCAAHMDYRNRGGPMREPQRTQRAFVESAPGGLAGALPSCILQDYVARDGATGEYAVGHLPAQKENPYRMDLAAASDLFSRADPEIIILGRSAMLHPPPIAEIRRLAQTRGRRPIIVYDASQTLGLLGPYFQMPFREGADIVTGSAHHTFFGTQRGLIGANLAQKSPEYELWKAIRRRTSPGMTSNGQLGSLLGLLMATIEMNAFKDQYQPQVLANAKAFARALKMAGLDVQGDPAAGYTETHQVIVRLGRADDLPAAQNLERNNIIVSHVALPGGTSPSARSLTLRMGVAEMTRFGMQAKDFEELAPMFVEALRDPHGVGDRIADFRARFLIMQYCFDARIAPDLARRVL